MKQPVRLLLVDDSREDVVLIREAMSYGKELRIAGVAQTGDEALAFLRREPPFEDAIRPDVILLDLNMPGMGGLELLAQLKADPAFQAIPVVMLTGSDSGDDLERAYAAGAASFIRKSADFDEFHRSLRAFALYWTVASRLPPSAPPSATA